MTKWLSAEEQASWRAWLDATLLLNAQLNRELQEQHGITLPDYEILVHLSEAPERRMRMSQLADRTQSSRSRLSHQIDRMAKEGLVERQLCDEDRRGAFAALTERGYAAIVASAPAHVDSVRRHLVDVLSPAEFAELGASCRRIADRLQEAQ